MPETYNGIAGNVGGYAATSAIQSSTNTSPIVIQTATAHGRATGDTVAVAGHQGNTAANQLWTVTVIDSTHLSLNGSTGNGVGGATGTLYPHSYATNFNQPLDGEAFDVAGINVQTSALADRSVFNLKARYQLADYVTTGRDDDTNANWAQTGTIVANTWSIFLDPTATFDINWTLPFTLPGDILELDLTGVASTPSSGVQRIGLGYTFGAPGAFSGSFTKVPQSSQSYQSVASILLPFNIHASIPVNGSGVSSTLIWPIARSSVTSSIILYGDYNFTAKVWRPTGLAQ